MLAIAEKSYNNEGSEDEEMRLRMEEMERLEMDKRREEEKRHAKEGQSGTL